jgi:hypothetical protein
MNKFKETTYARRHFNTLTLLINCVCLELKKRQYYSIILDIEVRSLKWIKKKVDKQKNQTVGARTQKDEELIMIRWFIRTKQIQILIRFINLSEQETHW